MSEHTDPGKYWDQVSSHIEDMRDRINDPRSVYGKGQAVVVKQLLQVLDEAQKEHHPMTVLYAVREVERVVMELTLATFMEAGLLEAELVAKRGREIPDVIKNLPGSRVLITPEIKMAMEAGSWDEARTLVRETYEGEEREAMLNLLGGMGGERE